MSNTSLVPTTKRNISNKDRK